MYRTLKRYNETSSTEDRPRTGRPMSARTPRNKSTVWTRIRRNPRHSMRKMAADLHMDPKSMRNLVIKDLGPKSLKTNKVHKITPLQKRKRLERSKYRKRRFAISGTKNVLFSDEKIFNMWKPSKIGKMIGFCHLTSLLSLSISDTRKEPRNRILSWYGLGSLPNSEQNWFLSLSELKSIRNISITH